MLEPPIPNKPEAESTPIAEDNALYFELCVDPPSYKCKFCNATSEASTIAIIHDKHCMTWLRMRLETLVPKHKLRFQVTKLMPLPVSGSYPIYCAHLCLPFCFEMAGYDETPDGFTRKTEYGMLDARAPIIMSKAEIHDIRKDEIFRKKRVEATHVLLDMVEAMEVPARVAGRREEQKIKVWKWGTLSDHGLAKPGDMVGPSGRIIRP